MTWNSWTEKRKRKIFNLSFKLVEPYILKPTLKRISSLKERTQVHDITETEWKEERSVEKKVLGIWINDVKLWEHCSSKTGDEKNKKKFMKQVSQIAYEFIIVTEKKKCADEGSNE